MANYDKNIVNYDKNIVNYDKNIVNYDKAANVSQYLKIGKNKYEDSKFLMMFSIVQSKERKYMGGLKKCSSICNYDKNIVIYDR